MRLILLVGGFLSFIVCQTASAGQKIVTCYLDGARVEQEAEAVNGYLEYALPDSLTPGSFRVKPLSGGSILRVELVPAEQDRRRVREIARLEERKGELQDRLQALARREEIFSAAAKSQSGKGLKKTKSNPDPLGAMQQGTDLALTQLDAVYRNERKYRSALDLLERELATARRGTPLARIWTTGAGAKVSFLVGSERWTPCYDFRWSGDADGELLLHARLPQPENIPSYPAIRSLCAAGAAQDSLRSPSSLPPWRRGCRRAKPLPSGGANTWVAVDLLEGGLRNYRWEASESPLRLQR